MGFRGGDVEQRIGSRRAGVQAGSARPARRSGRGFTLGGVGRSDVMSRVIWHAKDRADRL